MFLLERMCSGVSRRVIVCVRVPPRVLESALSCMICFYYFTYSYGHAHAYPSLLAICMNPSEACIYVGRISKTLCSSLLEGRQVCATRIL